MKDSEITEYVNHLRECTDLELTGEHIHALDKAIKAIQKNDEPKEVFWGARRGICDAIMDERGLKP